MPNSQIVGDTQVVTFWSWPEFVDFASANSNPEQSNHDNPAWAGGTKNLAAATELSRTGWEAGGKLVNAKGGAYFEEFTNLVIRPTIRMTDDGGMDFDMGAYLTGEPEHWFQLQSQLVAGAGQIVSMVVNLSEPANVSPDVIMNKGAMAATVAMLIERGGRNVEIIAALAASEHEDTGPGTRGKAIEVYIPVKRADETINLLSVAYALAHPSTLRRFAFSVMEQIAEPAWRKAVQVGRSYGYTSDVTHTGDVYVPSAHAWGDWTDPAKTRTWVLGILKAQGVLSGI